MLSLLDSGHSDSSIASTTGLGLTTVSRLWSKHHPNLFKATGGCPNKISLLNVQHALHLITSQKAENAVQVTKALSTITNHSLHPNTIHNHLKKAEIKAVVKQK